MNTSEDRRRIVMLGTDFHTMGGISSVVNVYREAGLFERFPIVYLASHADGGALIKIRYFVNAWLRYLWMLASGRVAALHVHVSTGVSFWRKLCFLLPTYTVGVPAILHLHSGDFDSWHASLPPWLQRLVCRVFDRAAAIIVLSSSWQQWVRSVSRNPTVVAIYNPVRLPPLAGDFATRDPAGLLFLGQFIDRKGAYDLVQAVARVVPAHPQLKLVMAGNGEVERVRAEVARLKLDKHVEVLDWVGETQKQRLLERASIYVLPSYCEGLPMSVLEAMAAGLPVICTPVGGVPEAVTDGCEGRLIVPGDVDALCEALDALLSRLELRQRMGEAARSKVESTFSVACVLPQVEQLYAHLGIHSCLR